MIRVLIAEDQALLCGALCEILSRDPDITVVAECSTGTEVVPAAAASLPDVAVLDIGMPGIDGLESARLLAVAQPSVRVLMLTVFGRPGYLRRAMNNGALSFMLKDASPERLIAGIKGTAAGERVVDGDLAVAALETGDCPLTERELEVLACSRDDLTTGEIAKSLHLSNGTVRNHLSVAIQKLHVRSRAEAARIAEDNGWL